MIKIDDIHKAHNNVFIKAFINCAGIAEKCI